MLFIQCLLLTFIFLVATYSSFIFTQSLLEELRNEKEKLLREVEEFETKTNELEQQLKESEEKLQLVVEFPSIDAKQQKTSQSDKEVMFNGEVPSEADVAEDMERQVMANNIRIMTLEEQNEKLRASIAYLMDARENISKKKVSGLERNNLFVITYYVRFYTRINLFLFSILLYRVKSTTEKSVQQSSMVTSFQVRVVPPFGQFFFPPNSPRQRLKKKENRKFLVL